jgi:hypothetical protein
MTSNEFILWLKGFAAAKQNSDIKQVDWEAIVDELTRVELYPSTNHFSFGGNALPYFTTTDTATLQTTSNQEKVI